MLVTLIEVMCNQKLSAFKKACCKHDFKKNKGYLKEIMAAAIKNALPYHINFLIRKYELKCVPKEYGFFNREECVFEYGSVIGDIINNGPPKLFLNIHKMRDDQVEYLSVLHELWRDGNVFSFYMTNPLITALRYKDIKTLLYFINTGHPFMQQSLTNLEISQFLYSITIDNLTKSEKIFDLIMFFTPVSLINIIIYQISRYHLLTSFYRIRNCDNMLIFFITKQARQQWVCSKTGCTLLHSMCSYGVELNILELYLNSIKSLT